MLELEKNNNEIARSTEDKLDHDDVDLTGVRAPEKCEECND